LDFLVVRRGEQQRTRRRQLPDARASISDRLTGRFKTPRFARNSARVRPKSLRSRDGKDFIVPHKLLDPTIDIVFKLLLLQNTELLRDMIEAVIEPPCPILELTVLNPDIPKEFPGDKTIVLDIRVQLADDTQIDLEMQSTVPAETRARFLYYWAKGFADALRAGGEYCSLAPCISILWFKRALLRNARFHSVFHLSEDHTREVFSPEIEFHVLELDRLHLATADRQARLDRWARFLRAETVDELEELAAEDDIMNMAKNALETLSSDPEAQRLASERETATLMHHALIKRSFLNGRVEGHAQGLDEGRNEAFLVSIRSMCEAFGIELDAERANQLSRLNPEQLEKLVQTLAQERRWPEHLQ
jgi:predicted transposase/invertase (TIGR01784 family)